MNYIYIGKVTNTHGIKGEIRIKSDFEQKEKIFKNNFTIYIGKEKKAEIIKSYRVHKEYDMVTFEDKNNINDVIEYKGLSVFINREDLNLTAEEYVLQDLIGMEIYSNEKKLGIVKDFMYNSSNILLQISGEKNFYIPYKANYIKEVNIALKKIVVDNIEGLIL